MFKLRKALRYEYQRFIGVEFTYGKETYKIHSFGLSNNFDYKDEPVFYLNSVSTQYIKEQQFYKDVEAGKIKLIKNVGV